VSHLRGNVTNAKENNREKEHHLFCLGSCGRHLGRFGEHRIGRLSAEFELVYDDGSSQCQHVETTSPQAAAEAESCCGHYCGYERNGRNNCGPEASHRSLQSG